MKNSKWRKNFRLLKIIAATFRLKPKYLILFSFNTLLGWMNSFFFLLDRLFFPSIRRHSLDRPVFMIGHLRSGTTFLHRFLSKNCASLRTYFLWEMILPPSSLKRMMKPILPLLARISLDKVYNPKIHKTGLQQEETDDIALYFRYLDGMLSWIYFHAWQDFQSPEELHGSLLNTCRQQKFITYLSKVYQALSFDSGKRILSKSFSSLYNIEHIKALHPDAKIIVLIRDPAETIPSMMSLEESVQQNMHGIRKVFQKRENYFKNLYALSIHYYTWLEKTYITYKDQPDYLFVAYEELRVNFKPTITKILDHVQITPDSSLKDAIDKQAGTQTRYTSLHEYSLEKFGLTADQIRKDFPFYDRFIGEIRSGVQNPPQGT
ncbi:MAG: sulfotransferase [Bacteroidales bacterium]|nr:sulfotransferase [Bacteroidales bacterium]